jgi:hypothetical protein
MENEIYIRKSQKEYTKHQQELINEIKKTDIGVDDNFFFYHKETFNNPDTLVSMFGNLELADIKLLLLWFKDSYEEKIKLFKTNRNEN